MAPFAWLRNCIDSWWLCLLPSPVSLPVMEADKALGAVLHWVHTCRHAHTCARPHWNVSTGRRFDEGVLVTFWKVKIALSKRYIAHLRAPGNILPFYLSVLCISKQGDVRQLQGKGKPTAHFEPFAREVVFFSVGSSEVSDLPFDSSTASWWGDLDNVVYKSWLLHFHSEGP